MPRQEDPDTHVGAVGFAIVLHVRERTPAGVVQDMDLSSADNKDILVCRPNGDVKLYDDVPFAGADQGGTGDGTDGKIMAVTIAGDLPIMGDYTAQADLEEGGWIGPSSKKVFTCGSKLVATI